MIIKFSHVIILKGVNEPEGGGEYHESLSSSASQVQLELCQWWREVESVFTVYHYWDNL